VRIKQGGNIGSASGRAKLKQRREPYWVVITRGCALGYRRGKKGGTWIARGTDGNGKLVYQALGPADDLNDGNGLTYESAQAEARRFFSTADGGKLTVADVLDRYLAHVRDHNPPSTVYDYETRIEGILKPQLGSMLLRKLSTLDIERWKTQAVRPVEGNERGRAPDTVNRLLAILKAALNQAWQQQLVDDDSPWRRVKPFRAASTARKVFFTSTQIRALTHACKPEEFKHLVQAALLTGARYGELTSLRVSDFDEVHGALEIRNGKTGSRTVFLSDESVTFFARLAKFQRRDALMLPRADGKQWGDNHHQKPFDHAVKLAGLDPASTFYALRHTHISQALLAGVNIQVLAENCGTSVRMIEKHYGKFLSTDRRAMFNQTAGLLFTA